jgi:L-ascorbate metabolism protein UlaG (beta-lactamase superfamily)
MRYDGIPDADRSLPDSGRSALSTQIRFLGVAGYEIVGPRSRIVVDPFLTGNPFAPVAPDELETPDVILVSHGAFDHFGDTPEIALRTGAPVVCGADVRAALLERGVPDRQIRATVWGLVVEIGGVVVRPVECHHWSSRELLDGSLVTGVPLAFIVETEPGVRIYHYGDTSIFDMALIGELYEPTVAILGCSQPWELLADDRAPGRLLTGELSPLEAARVAEMLRAPVVLASHYLSAGPDVEEFLSLVASYDTSGERRALAPAAGESVTVAARRPSRRSDATRPL